MKIDKILPLKSYFYRDKISHALFIGRHSYHNGEETEYDKRIREEDLRNQI